MTDVIKLRSPSDGNGKDPNDTRNDPNYRDKLVEGIADGILNGEAVCLCAVGRWAYEPVPDTG